MLNPDLTPQADAGLDRRGWPLRGIAAQAIEALCASDGTAPDSDPVPLVAPNRQIFLRHPQKPRERVRIVFCVYLDRGILHVSIVERAPLF